MQLHGKEAEGPRGGGLWGRHNLVCSALLYNGTKRKFYFVQRWPNKLNKKFLKALNLILGARNELNQVQGCTIVVLDTRIWYY